MSFDLASLSGSTSKDDLDIGKFFTSLFPNQDHGNDTNKPSPSSYSEVDNFDNKPLEDFLLVYLLDKVDNSSFGDDE